MEEGKEEKVEEARWDPEEFHTEFAKNKIKRNYSGHLADFSKAFHPGCSAARTAPLEEVCEKIEKSRPREEKRVFFCLNIQIRVSTVSSSSSSPSAVDLVR